MISSTEKSDETVADFILAKIKSHEIVPHDKFISLQVIKTVLLGNKDWEGWWDYHAKDLEEKGWTDNSQVYVDDLACLFPLEGAIPYLYPIYKAMSNITNHQTKVSTMGDFLPCSGSSVVVNVGGDVFWAELHNGISQIGGINEGFVMVPLTSWHMTLFDLKCAFGEVSAQSIAGGGFNQNIRAEGLKYYAGIIFLEVALTESQQGQIDSMAAGLGDAANVRPQTAHVTLALQFQNLPVSHLKVIEQELEGLWDDCLSEGLMVGEPRVQHFKDMKDFRDPNNRPDSAASSATVMAPGSTGGVSGGSLGTFVGCRW